MMQRNRPSAAQIPLSPQAEAAIKDETLRYGESLLLHAKLVAARQKSDEVQTKDVEKAIERQDNAPSRSRWRDLALTGGGALLGAALSGFTSAYNATPVQKAQMAVFAVMGWVGLILMFIGFAA
jgi:hypothetical protein